MPNRHQRNRASKPRARKYSPDSVASSLFVGMVNTLIHSHVLLACGFIGGVCTTKDNQNLQEQTVGVGWFWYLKYINIVQLRSKVLIELDILLECLSHLIK